MRFRVHLFAASVALVLAIWLSSGTMSPFAATWAYPIVSQPCGYLYNPDHSQYLAAFQMVDGQPRALWQSSIVLRRILYPLVAYPFMKVAGFTLGGFIASLLINLAALIVFAGFVRKRWGDRAAVWGMWLFAVYPGITYWAAVPYANACIVPVSCGLFALLTRLDERTDLRSVAVSSLAMGVLVTAYDLLPYFGVAAMIVLARRRRWSAMPLAAACLASGPAAVWLILTRVVHLDWSNANTDIYSTMIGAYLHPPALGVWLRGVAAFPVVLVQVFLFSNMVFLPVLFLVCVVATRVRPTLVEGALFIAIGLVFAFNNLAPPYPDTYQMRGDYIPRIYQPVGIALLVYCCRVISLLGTLERPKAVVVQTMLALTIAANLTITFGPVARVPWAGRVYQRFYFHAFLDSMDTNLALHGRRPLGFCGRK